MIPARPAALRAAAAALSVGLCAALSAALWIGIDTEATHPALAWLAVGLFAVNALWLGWSAVTALIGIRPADPQAPPDEPAATPNRGGPCAVLWLICGEDPEPLAARIEAFLASLARSGQDRDCRVFVLSDTPPGPARVREAAAFARLRGRVVHRIRPHAAGRKPGNLRDWLGRHGAAFQTMLVLDADSGFGAARLAAMRARMAAEPRLGLLQAAIRLRPGPSRFAEMQRLSARLCGPVFARGLSRLSGDAGNYWGHNALLRVAAFAEVADPAPLPGRPPFGGPVLSHDFIEAAQLRRNGWAVRIDPDSRGSSEDTPADVAAHLRRDRRWAQGNLQHLRLIGGPGLHPMSRGHLAAGIQSYLAAPIWLALVLLMGSGAVHATPGLLWPLLGALALLLAPKLAGLAARPGALRGRWRRRVMWRAFGRELLLTTAFAPIGMIRRTGFVAAVLAGRDGGWTPSGRRAQAPGARGLADLGAGCAIVPAVILPQAAIGGATAALVAGAMVAPVAAPLLLAPLLVPWLDRRAARDPVAAYYDAATRRFLALGGSGGALAIHRPLWPAGIDGPEAAAAHVNDLIAAEAEAALGGPPDRVRDLGCGVGGTLFHLARRWPATGFEGVTLSAEQVRIAEHLARARGLAGRCRFLRSDFTLPTTLPRVDLAVAVESHVHAASAADFLAAAAAQLRPGGVLIVVDDMLAVPEAALSPSQAALVAAFRRGWRLGHVPPRDGLAALADAAGFDRLGQRDLSGLLKLDRLRDRALRVAGPLADRLGLAGVPLFGNMIGGNALTQAHRAGIMCYALVAFRARVAATLPEATDHPDRVSAA